MPTTAIDELLHEQERIITRSQARELGVTAGAIRAHVEANRWRPVFEGRHGIFAVGQGVAPLKDLQRVWAALLAVGGDTAASHETAIWLAEPGGPLRSVHVATLDGRCTPRVPGVVVHTLPALGDEVVHPALQPRRVRYPLAVIDAAHAAATQRGAMGHVYTAIQSRRTTASELAAALNRRKRHRYRALLESVLIDAADGMNSGLEREHARCMRRHGLPVGKRQRKAAGAVGGRWIDVVVSEEAGLTSELVTELDGRVGHDKAEEQWRDMDRDNLDEEAGRGHLRYGPAQVFEEGCRVAGQTGRSLARRGWRGKTELCGAGCRAQDAPTPA